MPRFRIVSAIKGTNLYLVEAPDRALALEAYHDMLDGEAGGDAVRLVTKAREGEYVVKIEQVDE